MKLISMEPDSSYVDSSEDLLSVSMQFSTPNIMVGDSSHLSMSCRSVDHVSDQEYTRKDVSARKVLLELHRCVSEECWSSVAEFVAIRLKTHMQRIKSAKAVQEGVGATESMRRLFLLELQMEIRRLVPVKVIDRVEKTARRARKRRLSSAGSLDVELYKRARLDTL